MLKRLLPDPFILALLGTLAFATMCPARGWAALSVSWLSTVAIVLLFFFHGAKLSGQAVLDGVRHWRLHVVILAITFVVFPLIVLPISLAWPALLSSTLWTGVLFLAALPSTVQSAIAFTSIAQGNVPAAIASASASQILGVFLTAPLLALLAGVGGHDISLASVGGIILMILAPFLLGHLARPWIGDWVARHKIVIASSDRATILIAVYSAFSAAVVNGIWHRLPVPLLLKLLAICIGLLLIALAVSYALGHLLGFRREDRIAILFCGTKKSLVQGVPMARVLFPGPDLGLILLPIMLFHQVQLMACASIARRYAKDDNHE